MTILSNGHQWKYTEFTDNKNYSFNKKEILSSLTSKEINDGEKAIKTQDQIDYQLSRALDLIRGAAVFKKFYKG